MCVFLTLWNYKNSQKSSLFCTPVNKQFNFLFMLTCPPLLFFHDIHILDFSKPKKQQKLSNKEKLSSSFYTQSSKVHVQVIFFLVHRNLFILA